MARGLLPSLAVLAIVAPALAAPASASLGDVTACHFDALCAANATSDDAQSAAASTQAMTAAAVAAWLHALEPLTAAALPDHGRGLLLLGGGVATVTVNGRAATCEGATTAVVEASLKPFNMEPSITFTDGGSTQQGGFFLPCFEGQKMQPIQGDLQPGSQFPDGPWHAIKVANRFVWDLEVGAPQAGGRHVSYSYASPDGQSRATFSGVLAVYR